MTDLNINNFEQFLKDNPNAVVDLWAPWCGPCRMLGPVIEEVVANHPDYQLGKVNVDENEEIARQFNCVSIPMVLFFKDGKVVKQFVGYKSKEALEEYFD